MPAHLLKQMPEIIARHSSHKKEVAMHFRLAIAHLSKALKAPVEVCHPAEAQSSLYSGHLILGRLSSLPS